VPDVPAALVAAVSNRPRGVVVNVLVTVGAATPVPDWPPRPGRRLALIAQEYRQQTLYAERFVVPPMPCSPESTSVPAARGLVQNGWLLAVSMIGSDRLTGS
jgi:hypothetical protein